MSGQPVSPQEPADAIALGVGYCSEDRKADGIVPDMSVRENMTLGILPRLTSLGIVDEARQREIVDKFMNVSPSRRRAPSRRFGAFRRQSEKALLARWLCTDPKLLILDEPTRGIDVGAKAEIQALIRELADQGLGVLIIPPSLRKSPRARIASSCSATGARSPTSHTLRRAPARSSRRWHIATPKRLRALPVVDAPTVDGKGSSLDVAAFFKRHAALAALIVLLVFNFAVTPHFASWQTLNVNLTQVATIVIVSVGMTLVIATGGIDLSVGSLMAISGALAPMIFLSSFGALASGAGRRARLCRSGLRRRPLWFVQRLVHHPVPGPADRRHAGHVHRPAGHRAGLDQRQSASVQEPDVSVHRPRV